MGAGVLALPPPVFVNDADGLDPNKIVADMIAAFEAAAGRTLQPAQVERLLINLYAYRESLVRNAIQYAGTQCLVASASYPMLDYLGQLLGVTRLGEQPAVTTMQFTLANALTVSLTIGARTLAGTSDGAFTFSTNAALTIPPGATTGSVGATCTAPGAGGNGYLAGQVSVLLNPNALIQSVTNITASSGGSAPETDDHLRARIQLAPNQFSVAGPGQAYKFFALGVDPAIVDVSVTSPGPGVVCVYVLTGPVTQPAANGAAAGAIAGSALLAEIAAALSADTVRPLTDTVNVYAVTEADYQIVGTVTLYSDADPVAVGAAVNQAAQQFVANLASRVGRNVAQSQIIAALSVAGVYEVALSQPAADVILPAGGWANCTAIQLTIASGTEHS